MQTDTDTPTTTVTVHDHPFGVAYGVWCHACTGHVLTGEPDGQRALAYADRHYTEWHGR